MSQAHAEAGESVTTNNAATTQTPRPKKDIGLLLGLNETVHRERRIDVDSLVTYLTHAVREDFAVDGTTEPVAVAYSEAASTIVDALEARFEPLVDIQYARRNLDETHSNHEISLDDLRTAFDDSDDQAAPGSVELYNDVVLPMLSEFARRFTTQRKADREATREAARRQITECIVARTDMNDLSPTDVEFAVAEAKQELEHGGVWR